MCWQQMEAERVHCFHTHIWGRQMCGSWRESGREGQGAPPGSNLTSRATVRAGIALLLQFPAAGGEPGQRAAKASRHGQEHNEFNTQTQKYVYVCMCE